MIIKSLKLENFRSYSQKSFNFSPQMTVVVGANASGKTNLLEAIRLLAIGHSLRVSQEAEMISYNQTLAKIIGEIKDKQGEKTTLSVFLLPKKHLRVNGVPRRKMDFVGNLKTVYFGPEDLRVIFDSPSGRRNWLDLILEAVDSEYRRANLSYQKGLRQRNKLLEQIRDEGKPRTILFFWNKLLLENGEIITQKRKNLIEFVNQQPQHFGKIILNYDQSLFSPQRLEKYADAEVAAAMTLIGPHRDDFQVLAAKKRNLHQFGSRGEQRIAVFALKLAELAFINQQTQEEPVLLLDDIFSELDHQHRKKLLQVIPKRQTIITTTDIHLLDKEYKKKVEIINI